jgi:hypothetical protein
LVFRADDAWFEFIADVTAPSNQGFHDRNLVNAFEGEFWRLLKKNNCTAGEFTNVFVRGISVPEASRFPSRETR